MIQKDCRLARAARCFFGGGGGGGSTDINQMPGGFRSWLHEQPDLTKGYQFQQDQYGNFVKNNPLLNAAQGGALNFWNQLPGMLNQFRGFGSQLSADQSQLGGLYSSVGRLGSNFSKFLGPTSALSQAYGGPGGIGATLASHGALTPDQTNAAIQQGRISGSQSGSLHDPSGLIADYTSRKAATDANFNQALAQSQSVLGQQTGAVQGMEGISGMQAGLVGQRAGLTGQRAGLLGQQQALQTGGLNQLLGVGNAGVSQFGGLTNPILSYIQGIFGGNQQAAIAQAQVNAQQNAAGSAKSGGAASGIGSIIGAVLPLLFSDERIKTKIKDTGIKTDDDVPIKTFEYKTKPGVPYIGVMAQDVEKVRPDAVVTDPTSGVKMVNFWKVQVPMAQLNRGKI